MNVFICMVTTANGLITAGVPHDQWVSEASWNNYLQKLASCDVAIIGSKTYEVMHDEEFLPELKYVVLTTNTDKNTYRANVEPFDGAPTDLIKKLETEGHKQVGIFGGATTLSSFLKAKLVDEIFQDVASFLSGSGKNLVTTDLGEHKLELAEVKQLDKQTVQLHYKVVS